MFTLKVLPQLFAICRLDKSSETPAWATGAFVSITRTDEEPSIVCEQSIVPEGVVRVEHWRRLQVLGPLDLSMTGVLASLSTVLAEAEVSVFAIGTFDTDYLLVRDADLEKARRALRKGRHEVIG